MKPGGLLFASVHLHPALWSRHDVKYGHYRRYSKGEVIRLLEGYGFRLVGRRFFVSLLLPLVGAAMMNATRWALYERLRDIGLSVECGTGALTKFNRERLGLPKTHYYDACCVGGSTPENLIINQKYVQVWTVVGRGSRKMSNTDKHGFPISHRSRQKMYFGFMAGDLVVAEVPKGKYAGRWAGRVAVRSSGYFDVKDSAGERVCQGVSHRHFRLLQRTGGWQYEKEELTG